MERSLCLSPSRQEKLSFLKTINLLGLSKHFNLAFRGLFFYVTIRARKKEKLHPFNGRRHKQKTVNEHLTLSVRVVNYVYHGKV